MHQSIFYKALLSICLLFAIYWTSFAGKQNPYVSIITDQSIGSPVQHGLNKLIRNLVKQNISYELIGSLKQAKGKIILIAGLSSGNGTAAKLAHDTNQPPLNHPESLTIWKTKFQQKPVWVINGADDRGLMYALLDVAERVSWSSNANDPFREVIPVNESPEVVTRAISMYTMNRAYWESRFYNDDYWSNYMDMLAKNRFNCIVLIFGYENGGFLAPCYPYFFSVDGFPSIKMGNLTVEEQEKNLLSLNRMIEMAHERGIDFKVGIWDHIYRGGIQTGGLTEEEWAKMDKNHLVEGLNASNLSSYTKAALAKLIQKVPGLDGIQFRMHNESGLKKGAEMELFWTEVFNMLKTTSPKLQIDLRAKDLPESIIQIASNLHLNYRITTKYWMEQMGLPFHPTHINRENQFDRRQGYADMLSYPKKYKLHWRLWTGGTQRILLWGDPQYVQRFVGSTHLYQGEGFEVNEPLATKMEAQAHNLLPFELLNPPYVYYTYEFERYWHFFQVFGRLGYNPNTSSEVWDQEFKMRFGNEAGGIVEKALHKSSWVLPTIVAACSPYAKFPTTCGWPEKQNYGDLPQYAMAEGSDIQQFASFDTEAQLLIEGGETAKQLPSTTSLWFAECNGELNQLIAKAENLRLPGNKEFFSTLTDLKILSNLALYHSRRIPAAINYRIYKRTNDPYALDDAIAYEKQAIEAWRNIVTVAGDVYAPNLMFGTREILFKDIKHRLTGHWNDELGYLEDGLKQLQNERTAIGTTDKPRIAPIFKAPGISDPHALFQIKHQPITSAPVDHNIEIKVSIKAAAGIKWVRLRYRAINQHLDYETLPMKLDAESDFFQATLSAGQIDPKFDFMYFFEVMDNDGHSCIYPNLNQETPYFVATLQRK